MTASTIAVAALWIAGGMPGWLLVVLAALTIAACALPDTVIPAVFVAAYAASWVTLTDRGVTIWLLAAALGIGGFHLATAAAGTIHAATCRTPSPTAGSATAAPSLASRLPSGCSP